MSDGRPKEFQGQLLKLREARRLADRDAQLLANRIALLESEEQKAWKKIKQTKERAENILELRSKHQEEKKETRRRIQKDRKVGPGGGGRQRGSRSYVNKEVGHALHKKQQKLNAARTQKIAADMKKEQASMARDRREQANLTLKKNKARRDQIYKAKQDAIAKRRSDEAKIISKNKKVYDERVYKETKQRKNIERYDFCFHSFCAFVHFTIIFHPGFMCPFFFSSWTDYLYMK